MGKKKGMVIKMVYNRKKKISSSSFSLKQIGESGQCFRFNQIGENKYALIAFGNYLEIEQRQEEISFFCTEEEYNEIWYEYFDMGRDYNKYIKSIAEEDSYLYQAVQFGKGIRILQQDIWEVLVSFIISQQNNIKRIKKSIELLCERFGEKKHSAKGVVYFDFPSIEALANASEEELKNCNLGYRSRYIRNTANSILNQEVNLESLKETDYKKAKEELKKLCGVGNKVADCICLFGLHQLEAFPVDTHIKKVLEQYYPDNFPFEQYKGYEGVIQQYIFYYDLKNSKITR